MVKLGDKPWMLDTATDEGFTARLYVTRRRSGEELGVELLKKLTVT